MTTSLVRVSDLTIDLPLSGSEVTQEVSFTVAEGGILGVVGESGSGKTSIGLALLGFARDGARLAAGSVSIDGVNLLALPQERLRELRGATVAYVAQDPGTALNPALRLGDQLGELIRAHDPGRTRVEAAARIGQMMDEVGLPTDPAFLRRFPHQVSGGQQQRVCIAMAFLLDPRVVVLDEPTTGLDVVTQARVLALVRRMCTEHAVAAIYISHDLAVVSAIADRVVVLYAGEVVESGPRATVLQAPRHPYSRALLRAVPDLERRRHLESIPGGAPAPGRRPGGCSFHPRCPLADDQCVSTPPRLLELDDAHQVRCHHADRTAGVAVAPPVLPDLSSSPSAAPALSVSGLAVAYADQVVLSDIGFEVSSGECLAIVGESGSGKTTLSRTIAGLVTPSAGTMMLNGQPLPAGVRRRSQDARRAVQYVFQNPYASLNPRKSILDILIQPLRVLRSLGREEARHEAERALARVGLSTGLLRRYPAELSGGERQRVAIARAVACRPSLLICDEVTSALDVSAQAAVVELLRQLVDELGLSLIFVTHDLALVRALAERTAVLQAGRMVEIGQTASLISDPQHVYARSLIGASPSLTPSKADPDIHPYPKEAR